MKYTIIIPTMWLHTGLLQAMVTKYDNCDFISEVLIINNDEKKRIDLTSRKVRVIGTGVNVFVNPAWNLGVKEARTEGVVLANDDIMIPELDTAMKTIDNGLRPGVTIFPHKSCYPRMKIKKGPPRLDPGDTPSYGFGVFMVMCRESYRIVPEEIKVWWGDHLQWDYSKPVFLKGIEIQTKMRGTTSTMNLRGVTSFEKEFYHEYIKTHTPETYPPHAERTEGTVVLVLRGGGDFTFRDVLLLTDHLRERSARGAQVKCLLDKAEKVWDLTRLQLLPMHDNKWKGWWSKMNLFAPEMEPYRPFLYLDLDTAVVGDLQGILPPTGNEDKFITLEDFYRKNQLASGMMWIPRRSDKVQQIWNQWIANPHKHMKQFRGDQDFLRAVTTADAFWQNITGKISSFKPKSAGKLKTLPEGISVVCFHGRPRIWQAAETYNWVRNYIKI